MFFIHYGRVYVQLNDHDEYMNLDRWSMEMVFQHYSFVSV